MRVDRNILIQPSENKYVKTAGICASQKTEEVESVSDAPPALPAVYRHLVLQPRSIPINPSNLPPVPPV